MWTASVSQSCPTLCDPTDCSTPGFSVHGILQARVLEWGACPSPRGLPGPGIEPWSPTLQADSLPFELQGSLNASANTLLRLCSLVGLVLGSGGWWGGL